MDAYLALGSNLGDREANLRHAIRRLAGAGEVTGLSSVYETDPVGYLDQPDFLNMVVRLRTDLDPHSLLELIRTIESERGRERSFPNAPRALDIDLLLLGDRRIRTHELEVPHPRMRDRAFVMVPLLEIDPGLREPGSGLPYADLVAPDAAGVRRAYEGHALLGEEER